MNGMKTCYPADGTVRCYRKATRFFTITDARGNVWYRRFCNAHLIPTDVISSMNHYGIVEEVGEVYFDILEIHNS